MVGVKLKATVASVAASAPVAVFPRVRHAAGVCLVGTTAVSK